VVSFALLCSLSYAAVIHNTRPIIGILAQPATQDLNGPQYIAASYVKWIESGGARVVPIRYGLSLDELSLLFNSLNGLVLPGGGGGFSYTSPFWIQLQQLFSWALQANAKGDYFPIWGTCFGFQLLHILASENLNLLVDTDSENYTIALNFTSHAPNSRMYGTNSSWLAGDALITPQIVKILSNSPVTMNNHHYGVTPASYTQNKKLGDFFTMLSTNVDRNGKEFVSSAECKLKSKEGWNFPVYSTQWHPEKPQYEWDPYEVTMHDTDAILANSYTSKFFVREARRSGHKFESEEELLYKYLIYNYPVTYNYKKDPEFEQIYLFTNEP